MSERDHSEDVCRRVGEQLPAFLAGELPDHEGEALARHLEECAECAAQIALEPELRRHLDGSVELAAAPTALRERIRRSIAEENKAASPSRWRLALAAAAVFLVLANVGAYFKIGILPHEFVLAELRIRASLAKIHALLGVGLGDHLICAVYRRLAADPPAEAATVSEIGADWAPLADIASTYAPSGFEVRLAHRCEYGGRDFVHLIMFDGQQLASLVVTERRADDSFAASGEIPAARLGTIALYQGAGDDFGVSAFETNSYLVFLVSNLSTADQAAAATAYFPHISTFLASVVPSAPSLD
ncbi:MAG: zf-HC2 domain-containing protein [Acidobacteria bacterium]|nr:zf-HC2 domain-containing protein [Acidobacteriota bacterium]